MLWSSGLIHRSLSSWLLRSHKKHKLRFSSVAKMHGNYTESICTMWMTPAWDCLPMRRIIADCMSSEWSNLAAKDNAQELGTTRVPYLGTLCCVISGNQSEQTDLLGPFWLPIGCSREKTKKAPMHVCRVADPGPPLRFWVYVDRRLTRSKCSTAGHLGTLCHLYSSGVG